MNNQELNKGQERAIELHIEELTLHGFAPGDRHLVADAMKQELIRLLSEQGLPSPTLQDEQFATLDGGDLNVGAGMKPKGVGTQVAGAVFGELTAGLSSRTKIGKPPTGSRD